MSVIESRYRICRAEVNEKKTVLTWADGHQSSFHPLWLRHQCTCQHCGTPRNAVRRIRLHHIPHDVSPKLEAHTTDQVCIAWSNDNHRSVYQARWLRDNCYSEAEREFRRHRPLLWDATIAKTPLLADLEQAEADPQARLTMLQAVRDYGFCRINNVPTQPHESHRLIELVGTQRQTNYGTYTLAKKMAVDNVGDITDALDPHNDETYRLSTIGITVFQVLRASSHGGDSTLVDGFEAVRRLR